MHTKELTIKQEKFCQEYIETGNASEAYRRAYNASKMTQGTIRAAACLLMKKPIITQRVAELKNEIKQQYDISRERIASELAKIVFAKTDDKIKIADKIRAADVVCKLMGLNTCENNPQETSSTAILMNILQ
jgi:phage terminase small subunit